MRHGPLRILRDAATGPRKARPMINSSPLLRMRRETERFRGAAADGRQQCRSVAKHLPEGAYAAAFLISNKSSCVNARTLLIDAGPLLIVRGLVPFRMAAACQGRFSAHLFVTCRCPLSDRPASSAVPNPESKKAVVQTLEPYKLGPITLSNRIVMAPLTRNARSQAWCRTRGVDYYGQRASRDCWSPSEPDLAAGQGYQDTPASTPGNRSRAGAR